MKKGLEKILKTAWRTINNEDGCMHNGYNFDCALCQAYLEKPLTQDFDDLRPEPLRLDPPRGEINPTHDFFPTNTGFGVQHQDVFDRGLGEIHDAYKVDRYDNLYDGHTTLRYKDNLRLGNNRITLNQIEQDDYIEPSRPNLLTSRYLDKLKGK